MCGNPGRAKPPMNMARMPRPPGAMNTQRPAGKTSNRYGIRRVGHGGFSVRDTARGLRLFVRHVAPYFQVGRPLRSCNQGYIHILPRLNLYLARPAAPHHIDPLGADYLQWRCISRALRLRTECGSIRSPPAWIPTPPRGSPQTAYANIADNPQESAAELWEDVAKGRLVLCAEQSDAYTGNLMESKLAYVLQKDSTDPDAMRARYISEPRNEANDRIDNERHRQCTIHRRRNADRRVLYWKRRYQSIPAPISKTRSQGRAQIDTCLDQRPGVHGGGAVFRSIAMYLDLFFGRRPSPANWGLVSTLLMQYV